VWADGRSGRDLDPRLHRILARCTPLAQPDAAHWCTISWSAVVGLLMHPGCLLDHRLTRLPVEGLHE